MMIAVKTESVGIDFEYSSKPTPATIANKILDTDGVTEVSRQDGHPGIRLVYRRHGVKFTATWFPKTAYLKIEGKPTCCLCEANRLQGLLGGKVRERKKGDEPDVTPGAASSHETPAAATMQQTTVTAAPADAAGTSTTRTPPTTAGPRPTGTSTTQRTTAGTVRTAMRTFLWNAPPESANSFSSDADEFVIDDGILIESATNPVVPDAPTAQDAIQWIHSLDDPQELRDIAVQAVRMAEDLEQQVEELTRRMNEVDTSVP